MKDLTAVRLIENLGMLESKLTEHKEGKGMKEKIKVLTVGDIHGDDTWKKIDPEKYDYIRFCGDYFDSYESRPDDDFSNFQDIVIWANSHPGKISLGIGNHDISRFLYKTKAWERARWHSGYTARNIEKIWQIYTTNKHLFSAAMQINNTLWTHAGISNKSWSIFHKWAFDHQDDPIADFINKEYENLNPALFQVGQSRGGYTPVGGIFWADKSETDKDPLRGYAQIVGHTPVRQVETVIMTNDSGASITYTDTRLGNKNYYETVINEPILIRGTARHKPKEEELSSDE